VCDEVDGGIDAGVGKVSIRSPPERMMGFGEVGRDLARLEAKDEDLADIIEGDSAGELTIRSLPGE